MCVIYLLLYMNNMRKSAAYVFMKNKYANMPSATCAVDTTFLGYCVTLGPEVPVADSVLLNILTV